MKFAVLILLMRNLTVCKKQRILKVALPVKEQSPFLVKLRKKFSVHYDRYYM